MAALLGSSFPAFSTSSDMKMQQDRMLEVPLNILKALYWVHTTDVQYITSQRSWMPTDGITESYYWQKHTFYTTGFILEVGHFSLFYIICSKFKLFLPRKSTK